MEAFAAIANLLEGLGAGVASNAVYDILKSALQRKVARSELAKELSTVFLNDADIVAEKFINACLQHGYIRFENTYLHAGDFIHFGNNSGSASFLNGKMGTLNTEMNVRGEMRATNTRIELKDGGVAFFATGDNPGVKFF